VCLRTISPVLLKSYDLGVRCDFFALVAVRVPGIRGGCQCRIFSTQRAHQGEARAKKSQRAPQNGLRHEFVPQIFGIFFFKLQLPTYNL
jgi:hypothetical protein